LGVYDEALNYFQRSYEIKIKNKIAYGLEMLRLNISSVLVELGNYKEAEDDARDILRLCSGREGCRSETLKHLKLVLSISLVHQSRNVEAVMLLQELLKLCRKDRVSEIRASAYHWLSRVKFESGLLDEAICYLDSGETICLRGDYKSIHLNNLGLYAELCATKLDFPRALVYQKQESLLRAELFNGKLVRSLSAIEAKQLEHENHLKILSQERELKLKEVTIDQNRVILLSVGVIVLLLVVLSVLLIRNNRQKGKINELLSERVWERTKDLESSRGKTSHSKEELRLVVSNLMNSILASEATLKGLTHLVKIDLPAEHAVYFQNAEIVFTKMANYLRAYRDQIDPIE